jgi:hypothetical protein
MKETVRQSLLEDYLTEPELAKELKKSERTVQRWRKKRVGPPYTLNGETVLYHIESAKTWLKAGEINPVPRSRVRQAAHRSA